MSEQHEGTLPIAIFQLQMFELMTCRSAWWLTGM